VFPNTARVKTLKPLFLEENEIIVSPGIPPGLFYMEQRKKDS
jgi:hypothetical protein